MVSKDREGPYNTDIKRAVKYLYRQEVITADKDIVDKLGMSKGTVSGYLTGKVEASKSFRTKFEETFKLSLTQFNNDGDVNKNGHPPAFVPVSWQDYIKLIHASLEQLKQGQNQILDQQVLTRAEVRGYGKYHLVKDAKGKSGKFDELLGIVDKLVNEELSEDDGQGNPVGS